MLSNKDYQLLHIDQQGYVIQCNCCDHFQVAFGNTLLIFTEVELYDFWQHISLTLRKAGRCESPDLKQFQFPTPSSKMLLIFTFRELKALHKILEETHLSIDVQTLVQDIQLN